VKASLDFLTTGPALRTLAGCRSRIEHIGLTDLFALRARFPAVSLGALHRQLWTGQRKRKSVEELTHRDRDQDQDPAQVRAVPLLAGRRVDQQALLRLSRRAQ